jgi:hypothetical protein
MAKMSGNGQDTRDRAIADFFEAATELLKLCVPLIKQAVAENEQRLKDRRAR